MIVRAEQVIGERVPGIKRCQLLRGKWCDMSPGFQGRMLPQICTVPFGWETVLGMWSCWVMVVADTIECNCDWQALAIMRSKADYGACSWQNLGMSIRWKVAYAIHLLTSWCVCKRFTLYHATARAWVQRFIFISIPPFCLPLSQNLASQPPLQDVIERGDNKQ